MIREREHRPSILPVSRLRRASEVHASYYVTADELCQERKEKTALPLPPKVGSPRAA
jgi:hypothetical protein